MHNINICFLYISIPLLITIPIENAKIVLDETSSSSPLKIGLLTWSQIDSISERPDERTGHSSISYGDIILIFGGVDFKGNYFDDLWLLDTNSQTWTEIKSGGFKPSAREGHSATLIGSKMYIFGGALGNNYFNDLFIYDVTTQLWSAGKYNGPIPSPRAYHGASQDTQGRLVIFGGMGMEDLNDVYVLDPLIGIWAKPYISGEPPSPRAFFSMTRFGNSFYVFGGRGYSGVLNDLHVLDLERMKWTQLETQGANPSPRQGHGAAILEKNLIVIGGCDNKKYLCYYETYYLAIDTLYWTKLPDERTKNLHALEGFTLNNIGGILYLFGGCNQGPSLFNWVFAFDTNVYCPNGCSGQGVCRNNKCACSPGFFGSFFYFLNQDIDCSLKSRCNDDCNQRGRCETSQVCTCNDEFTGTSCEIAKI